MEKVGFGYVDDNNENLRSQAGGIFGLNQAFITVFKYNDKAGKDGADGDAVDITAMIGTKEFRLRIYDITGDIRKGDIVISPDDEGYVAEYNKRHTQNMAVVTHVAKALGVTDEQIKAALATPPANFAQWATIMTGLPSADAGSKLVDVFLEYEWEIGDGNKITFLQLPKNMKGGRFMCAAVEPKGSWKPVINGEGLRYVDDSGAEHPFSRNKNYMDSNKANQQSIEESTAENTGLAGSMVSEGGAEDLPAAETKW
jgi:hypothetical protein